MNTARDVRLLEIDLHQQGSKEFRRLELDQIFPEVLTAVYDAAIAKVEQVGRNQWRLSIISENIDVLAFGGGDLLLLFHLFHGGDEIARCGGLLEERFLRRPLHPFA